MFDSRYVVLAEALLDVGWSRDAHQGLLRRVSKRNSLAYTQLANTINDQLPTAPSRTQLLELLYRSSRQVKGLSWKRLDKVRSGWRLAPTVMRAPRAAHLGEQLPEIASYGYAAEHLLGLPISVVDWLSKSRGDHYVIRAIAKRRRGEQASMRILEQPKFRLKVAQRSILREILRWVPVHPSVHGFVRGRSVLSFVEPHIGQSMVLRMDLKNFFPSITAQRVSAVYRSFGYPHSVVRLLTDLSTTATQLEGLKHLAKLEPQVRLDLLNQYSTPHLPQGAPTSPALANLVAWRMDARLSGLARSAGIVYSRYADDLLFSGGLEFKRCAENFMIHAMAIASDEGFQVHPRKTRLMPESQRQQAAGYY